MTSLEDVMRELKEISDVDLVNVQRVTRHSEELDMEFLKRLEKLEAYVKAGIQLSLENKYKLKELKNEISQLRVEAKASDEDLHQESRNKTDNDGGPDNVRP